MGEQQTLDLIIIGAGLIGTSLALALAQQNPEMRITIIDRKHVMIDPEQDQRKIALSYGSQCIFEQLGQWQQLVSLSTAILNIHISDRGHFGATRFSAEEHGIPALGYVVPAGYLQQGLSAALANYANINFLEQTTVTDLSRQQNTNRVTLQQGNDIRYLESPLVVAADGTFSKIRELLSIPSQTKDYEQQAIVAQVQLKRGHHNTAYERFTGDGPIAMLPLKDNVAGLIWTVKASQKDHILALSDQQFLRALQKNFGYRIGRLEGVGQRQSYPLRMLKAKEQVMPGVVLLGNAAHTLHPIAAQGFNLGLRDVAALAEVVGRAYNQQHNLGSLDILQQYMDWRRREQWQITTFTHELLRLFSNRLPPLILSRGLGMLLFDLVPAAKRLMAKYTLGLAGGIVDI